MSKRGKLQRRISPIYRGIYKQRAVAVKMVRIPTQNEERRTLLEQTWCQIWVFFIFVSCFYRCNMCGSIVLHHQLMVVYDFRLTKLSFCGGLWSCYLLQYDYEGAPSLIKTFYTKLAYNLDARLLLSLTMVLTLCNLIFFSLAAITTLNRPILRQKTRHPPNNNHKVPDPNHPVSASLPNSTDPTSPSYVH